VVIVGIGEQSFTELDRPWPFPRALTAQCIEKIQAGKPKAIGIDLLFTEPSLFGPADDESLAAVLRKYDNVVLAAFQYSERSEILLADGRVEVRVYQALKLPVYPVSRRSVGFVNVHVDADGFVRRIPLSVEFRTAGRFESFAGQVATVAAGDRAVRRPPDGQLLISFRGPARTFRTVPFFQLLRGEIAPRLFAGKIVLIGATTPVMQDVSHTPLDVLERMPGVEVQANAVDNLLRGDPLRPAGRPLAWVLAILAAAAGARLGYRIPPPRSFLLIAATGCAVLAVAHAALVWFLLWIEQVPLFLGLFGAYFAVLVSGAPFRLSSAPPVGPSN
jgi:CHASE2 domain-containing sensor protein